MEEQKSKISVWIWIAGVVIVLIVGLLVIGSLKKKDKSGQENNRENTSARELDRRLAEENIDIGTASPKETDKFITASPVDINQIKSVTKFRSCSGHEYAGTNFNGEKEVSSSMKHYLEPIDALKNTKDKIKVYAPFDGAVVRIDQSDTWRGRQFVIEHRPFNGWYWTYVHVETNDKVKEGAEVKAGDLLGYANVAVGGSTSFDMSLQRFEERRDPYSGEDSMLYINLEPIFGHMVDSIYLQWKNRGVTAENTVISKTERDGRPCKCKDNNPGSTMCQYEAEEGVGGKIMLK